LFNIEEFDIKLDTELVGRNFIYFDEVDSTNSYLLNSKEETPFGTVVMSEYQLKGRGRKQRDWQATKEQALTFSILLDNRINLTNAQLLSLGTSLALAQALENLYQFKVNVKWPNDVLIDGKKIAGILIESVSKGSKIEKIVVGIGINVNQPNFTGKYNLRPTSVRVESKKIVSRERLLSDFLNHFELMLEDWVTNPQKIINDWKSRSRYLGEKIKIRENEEELFGVFEDVDENGYLILKTKGELRTIHSGDVSINN
jgi:BirA family biotin operon repressor/biotin-[acetyl-CoA-carboxylase] ligase